MGWIEPRFHRRNEVINIFKKKEKYHTLDRGLLAEAISIYSDEIDLEEMKYSKKNSYPSDSIQLNEHLKIKIDSAWHTSDSGIFMGFYCYLNYFVLQISTYVDKIKMATYNFQLDIKNNDELYRRWNCEEKNIIHYMPNQFIDLMNEWSNKIVSEFDENRNKKKEKEESNSKKKYDSEESILSKYK